jgi:hypothetical protein
LRQQHCRAVNPAQEQPMPKPRLLWDEDVLAEREANEHGDRLDKMLDRDFERAVASVARAASNLRRLFRKCPRTLCRRARRCCSTSDQCAVPRARTNRERRREAEVIDEIYALYQQQRRDAALAAEHEAK